MDVFPFDLLYQEHQRILAQSKKEGVTLRLLGALAFELCCQEFADLRLAMHDQTIPLADLLLEKLQIVQITEKDIIDIITLFLAHPVEQNESGINAEYIAGRMAWDWGFYHTSLINLHLVRDQQLPRFDLLSESQHTLVRARIEEMLQAIERVPKTVKWKLRAKVGTSVKWYKDGGDLVR